MLLPLALLPLALPPLEPLLFALLPPAYAPAYEPANRPEYEPEQDCVSTIRPAPATGRDRATGRLARWRWTLDGQPHGRPPGRCRPRGDDACSSAAALFSSVAARAGPRIAATTVASAAEARSARATQATNTSRRHTSHHSRSGAGNDAAEARWWWAGGTTVGTMLGVLAEMLVGAPGDSISRAQERLQLQQRPERT